MKTKERDSPSQADLNGQVAGVLVLQSLQAEDKKSATLEVCLSLPLPLFLPSLFFPLFPGALSSSFDFS